MKTISTFNQLCFSIAMSLTMHSNAQNFQQVFEGAGTFDGYMAAASAANPANTMVAGNLTDAFGNTDIHFMELDATGNVVSETKYGTPQTEKILWMESVAGDGYYFGGYTSDGSITEAIVGKLQLDNFVFVKKLDSGNPEVAKVCCTGKHYPAAMFTCRAAGDGQLELMQISPDLNTIIFSKDVRSASGATDLDVVTHIEEIQGVGYLLSGGANQAPGGLLASAVMLDYNLNILWSKRYGLNIGINNRCIATSATFDPVHGHILQLVNMEQGPEMAIRTYDLAGNVVAGKTVSIAMPGSGDVEGFRIFYRPQFTDILITGYQRNGTYTGDYDGDGIADIITGRMPVRIQLDANTLAVISCTRDIPSNPLIEPTYGAAATGYPRVHYPESVSYDLSLDISRNGNASLTPSGVSQLRVSTFDSAGNPACATDAPVCSTAPLTLPNFGSLSLLATSPTVIPVTMGIEPVASVSVSVCGETPPSICEGLTVDIVLVAELAGSVSLAVNGRDENGNMIPTESISFGNVSLGDGTLPFDLPPGISSLDHHYDANGEYLVCIDGTCVSGETATGCLSVDICVAPAQTFLTRNGHWVNFDPFTVTVEILWGDEEEGELAEICDDGSAEHTYSQPGTYEICYYPECDDQMLVCETIEINCADFIQPFTWTYDDLIGEVNFYSPSSLPFEIYYWTFGDAQTSSEQNPAHIFESEGTYPVCFTATCSDGNTAEICVDVEADNVDLQCTLPTDVVAVTDDLLATLTVFGPGSDPFEGRFLINWGDGEIQLAISSPFGDDFPIMFSHIYNTPGLVDVTVESTCFLYPNESVIFVRGIEPINEGCQPISQLVFETKEKATVTIEIIDTQTPPVSVEVNWGDGTIEPWSEPSIEHTYESEGYYVICVTGTCADGYITNHCEPVTVTCGDLLPSLLWQLGDEPGEINFFAPGSEPFEGLLAISNPFGDDFPIMFNADGIGWTHIFSESGTFEVCLTNNCPDGSTAQWCSIIEVPAFCPALPSNPITFSNNGLVIMGFWFENLISDEYFKSINWGDGTPTEEVTLNFASHLMEEEGIYYVCGFVECLATGVVSEYCSTFEISQLPCPCCPDGTIPWTLITNNSDQSATINVSGGGESTVVIQWGDGDVSTLSDDGTITHDYETCGPFTVTIEVYCYGNLLESSSYTTVLNFCSPYPDGIIPGFVETVSVNDMTVDVALSVVAVDNDDSEVVFTINWGDGSEPETCDDGMCSHDYADSGIYSLCVTGTHALSGVSGTHCSNVTVSQLPCPCCPNGTIPCTLITDASANDATIHVSGLGAGGHVIINWGDPADPGLHTVNEGEWLTHDYNGCGPYHVTIYIQCNENIVAAATFETDILPCGDPDPEGFCDPEFAYTISIDGQTAQVQLVCDSCGTGVDNDNTEIVFCTINWGNGNTETFIGTQALETYDYPGTYVVCITATCLISGTSIVHCETITVGEIADCPCCAEGAQFTPAACGYTLEGTITVPPGQTVTIEWGDGDVTTHSGTGPFSHTYDTCGTFTITITVYCNQEVVQTFSFSYTVPCAPDPDCEEDEDDCVPPVVEDDSFDVLRDPNGVHHIVNPPWVAWDNDEMDFTISWGDGETEACDDGDCSHVYELPGTYDVCVTATCSASGLSTTSCISIQEPEESAPIEFTHEGCEGVLAVNVIDFIYGDEDLFGPLTFLVDWGDGNSSESLVTLSDVNQDGLPDIIVGAYLDQDDDGDGISFEIISDADQNDVVLRWTHTYHQDGQFICTVMRADIDGEGVVSILDLAAIATEFIQGCAIEECDDLAYVEPIPGNDCGIMLSWWDCDKPMTSRMVSWGDGTSEICNDGCTHQYGGTDTGAYEVIANAFYVDGTYATEIISVSIAETCDDGNSCTLPTSISITQDTEDPTRFYYWPGEIPLATGEDGLPIPPPCSLNPDIVYDWDFGDGTTSSDCIAEHQYSTCGDFPVSLNVQFLTVEECEFFAAQFSTQLTVACPPVLQMNVVMDGCDAGVAFIIDGTGTWDIEADAIVSFHVNYGDGTTPINTIHSVHHYDQPGTYTITGTAVDNDNTEIVFTEVVVADCDVPCVGDLDNNGVINVIDLLQLMGVFGESCDDGLSE